MNGIVEYYGEVELHWCLKVISSMGPNYPYWSNSDTMKYQFCLMMHSICTSAPSLPLLLNVLTKFLAEKENIITIYQFNKSFNKILTNYLV